MSQLGEIYHMTDYVTDYMIMRFYDITITFFLNMSSNKYIGFWDYSLIEKKLSKPNKKLKKKSCMLINKKSFKLNKKIKMKTKGLD